MMISRNQLTTTRSAVNNASQKQDTNRRQKANTRESDPEKSTAKRPHFEWNDDDFAANNYEKLAKKLAKSGDLFRDPDGGLTCLKVSGKSSRVKKGPELLPIIVDRVDVAVFKSGKSKGSKIDAAHLNAMLGSELFLREFPVVDVISKVPLYLPDGSLTTSGFNDGGEGYRIFAIHSAPKISMAADAINEFFDVMAFRKPNPREWS